MTNTKCKELVFVLAGTGKIVVNDQMLELHEEDQVIIEPGEHYYFEGNLRMFMPCVPAWYPEQHIFSD